MTNKQVDIDGYRFEISRLEKVLYPGNGYTKQDVIDYYRKISDVILPHIENRVVSMQHFPDGIDGEGFYQKQIPEYFPKWFKRERVKLQSNGNEEMPVIEKAADLVYLANQAVLLPHIWLSKVDNIGKPDKIIFDLDPSPTNDIQDIKFAARKIKEKFEQKGLRPYIMTTGSKGFHVVMPIVPDKSFDEVRDFTHKTAEDLAEGYPDKFTTETLKKNRKGRIFLDYLRNSYGQTSVCPYSLRAIKGAPIATPIDWDELSDVKPQSYNISNIFRRLGAKDDPWRDFFKSAKSLANK